MSDRPYRGEIDFERLGRYCRILGVATRLQLLQKLQRPHAVADIRLAPFRMDRTRAPDRPLSRQAVETHLHKLEEIGFVRSRLVQREGRETNEYMVNQPRLFTLVDEMRRLSLMRPAADAGLTAGRSHALTAQATSLAPSRRAIPSGPCLVLVSGPLEGRSFPLEGDGPWLVGRAEAAAVSLEYDPFVSGRNAEVWTEGKKWFLHDLPGSRNGTMVNWRLLDEGEHTQLLPGDTVAFGRSLLVVRGIPHPP